MIQDINIPESINNTWIDADTKEKLEAVLTHVSCGLHGGVEGGHVKLNNAHVYEAFNKDYTEVTMKYILPPDGKDDTSVVNVTSKFHLYPASRQAQFKGIDVEVNYEVEPDPNVTKELMQFTGESDTGQRFSSISIPAAFIHRNLRDELEKWAWIEYNGRSLKKVHDVVKGLNITI